MAFCFFDKDYLNTYSCDYLLDNDELVIDIDLGNATHELLEDVFNNKKKIIYAKTISIIDHKEKFFIKTFFAFESNFQTNMGFPFVRAKRTYRAKSFFKVLYEKDLELLEESSSISRMIFYHEIFDIFLPNKSMDIIHNSDYTETQITLKQNKQSTKLNVSKNNIKLAQVSSLYFSNFDRHRYLVDYKNALEIEFKKAISISDIFSYKDFISTMCNLYCPINRPLYKMGIYLNNVFFEFFWKDFNYIPTFNVNINKRLEFDFYKYIESYLMVFKPENKATTNLLSPFKKQNKLYAEDMFLTFYRFLELVLKNSGANKDWLKTLITSNKPLLKYLHVKYKPDLYLRMETLRNHYVHEGYFIKNNRLKIKDGNGKQMIIKDELITTYSIIVKALAYKVIFTSLLKLNVKDKNFINCI